MSPGSGGCVGGGSGAASCASVSLGKLLGRALRGGGKRRMMIRDKGRAQQTRPRGPGARYAHAVDADGCVSSSVELLSGSGISSSASSWSSSSGMPRESVVRVVLSGGVVEVYAGVVLACTVIRKHPPGLCLAHPDVFRNPHGAMVRPLEPLFPGQKFFLLPESTVQKLQRDIPECSVGAFSDEEKEMATSTDAAMSSSESEEEREGETAPPLDECCARTYFVDTERWAEWHFKSMVARGRLAVDEQPQSSKKPKRRRRRRKRKELLLATAPSSGRGSFRVAPTPRPTRTTWEPSLPSVEEEDEEACPDHRQAPSKDVQDGSITRH